jgi:hypothetical protein
MAESARRKITSGRLRILSFDAITKKIERGEYQKHQFPMGFVITQIRDYDNERILEVVLLVGERFDLWKEELVVHLNKYAKDHRCDAVEAISRRGLGVALKDLGFRTTKVLLRKEVT